MIEIFTDDFVHRGFYIAKFIKNQCKVRYVWNNSYSIAEIHFIDNMPLQLISNRKDYLNRYKGEKKTNSMILKKCINKLYKDKCEKNS